MRIYLFIYLAVISVIFSQCNSQLKVNKGVICIQDSLSYPGKPGRNIYLYYRDNGLFGRSQLKYVAVEKEGKHLREKNAFYSDSGIMLIKMEQDSLYIFTATRQPNYNESSEMKYKVIVDTQTWKYPHPECYPVK